jgi:hypothetical protein
MMDVVDRLWNPFGVCELSPHNVKGLKYAVATANLPEIYGHPTFRTVFFPIVFKRGQLVLVADSFDYARLLPGFREYTKKENRDDGQ